MGETYYPGMKYKKLQGAKDVFSHAKHYRGTYSEAVKEEKS